MTTSLLGISVILLAMLLAVVGLVLVQRLVPVDLRESHTDALGIIYAVLYVMFGVLIGFSAYLVMNKYVASQSTAENEAGDVRAIYRIAEQLPEPKRDEIQGAARSYAQAVVDEEWPLMEQGKTSPRAGALADDLGRSVESFEPSTNAEQALYTQGLERIHDLEEDREVRLINVREGLPPILWFALITLGIDTVVFTYFVGMKSSRLHALAVAAVAGGIALILFTVGALDHPFGTEFRVGPDAFQAVLDSTGGVDESGTR